MRVFVSSTIYDLIDVRAEVAELLRELDIVPVMSDDKLSDFEVHASANSIETCLLNVAACDEVVVILNQRYGPKLGKSGFDDVSATHLEYRRAMELGRPVRFFVRDRTDADYTIWKKNSHNPATKLAWVNAENIGLFAFLEERKKLDGNNSRDCWYWNFTSSVDLKAALRNQYEERMLSSRLAAAIHQNAFPIFDVKMKVAQLGKTREMPFTMNDTRTVPLNVEIIATNVGGATAFNMRMLFAESVGDAIVSEKIVAPDCSVSRRFIYEFHPTESLTSSMTIEFESFIGIGSKEEYEFGIRPSPQIGGFIHGVTRKSQSFRRVPELALRIEGE